MRDVVRCAKITTHQRQYAVDVSGIENQGLIMIMIFKFFFGKKNLANDMKNSTSSYRNSYAFFMERKIIT